MIKPTKAIIPAAGFGTRFLPLTKAMPKEMLPIIDKPVIQIVVENLVAAGVTDIIIVTGASKRAVEDYFDRSEDIENELRARGKNEMADQLKAIAELADFVYVRQKGVPRGTARPLLNCAHLLSPGEPFYYLHGDEYYQCDTPWPIQLLETYEKTGCAVASMFQIDKKDADKYGMFDVEPTDDPNSFRIKQLVEKPGAENAPSNFASGGGYILTSDIIPIAQQENVGVGGEIVLADSVSELAKQGKVFGRLIEGKYQDIGNKTRYLEAVIDSVIADPEIGDHFREYIKAKL